MLDNERQLLGMGTFFISIKLKGSNRFKETSEMGLFLEMG